MNKIRDIKIEKVILNIGGIGEKLERGFKLLNILTNKKPIKTKSKKRIPSLEIRPGLEVGCLVTIRKKPEEMLRRLLVAKENKLSRKNIAENHFSFGIKEYIEIPGVEYQRDIGIIGLDVTVVLKRAGVRNALRKLKKSHIPNKQHVSKEEIIKFMEENFNIQFVK